MFKKLGPFTLVFLLTVISGIEASGFVSLHKTHYLGASVFSGIWAICFSIWAIGKQIIEAIERKK